jgi:hypothetical protein
LNSENIITATKPEVVEHSGFPENIPLREQSKNNIGVFYANKPPQASGEAEWNGAAIILLKQGPMSLRN